MLKQLSLFLGALLIVALVGAGCKQETTAPTSSLTATAADKSDPSCSGTCDTGTPQKVAVALHLPKGWQKSSGTRTGGKRPGGKSACPSTQMEQLMGLKFSSNHGCVIGTLTAGGPAEKSGLKAGDSIVECNGGEVTCPSTLDPLMWITPDTTAKLVVMRPSGGTCSVDPAKAKTDAAKDKTPETK